jgi:diguanylate cyclase (GGDEF)-like protein
MSTKEAAMTQRKIKPTDDRQRIEADQQHGRRRWPPVSDSEIARMVPARSSRAAALAGLAQTALGLPSRQELRTEPGAAHRSLTVREQSLFRAATRRALRAATVLGGFTLTAVALPFDIGMMLLVPERQLLLFAIVGIEALFIIGVTILAIGHWRLPPLPLAFALAFSLTVEMSCLLGFVPELRTPSLMLLGLLPPAIALFAPWSAKVHAGWLLAGAPVVALVTVVSPRGAVEFDELFGAGTVLAISALVSLAGSFGKARVRMRAFEHQMEARSAHLATVAREAELGRLNNQLALVTRTDPLTGLGNRRRLDEELAAAASRATRYDHDCAIALFDLDGFKPYNDALGHIAGDAALQAVATALVASVRETDTVCRFGGDEFVVVMPEQPLEGAARAAARMQRAVAELELRYPTPSGPQLLTISAGIALLGRSAAHDEDEVLRQADAELYRAKAASGNLGRGRAAVLLK